ncbi:MAG: hemolysin family protein [Candidatus Rifleibacteriota bacterium]
MEDPLSGLCFFILICFSAFFSATETAFFALSPLRLKKSESEGDESATEILTLLRDKQKMLMTILLGNTLANVLATAMAVIFVINKLPDSSLSQYIGTGLTASLLIASAFMFLILLIFAEFAPKTIAIFGAYSFSKIAVKPLKVMMFLFLPFTAAFSWLIKKLLPRYSDWNSRLGSTTSMDEIDSYFTLGEEVGIIERDEKEMINSVFEFGDTLVREVMIPRPDIISMPLNIELDEMLTCIREDGHSRFPVYDGSLDRIVGILYVKDILMKLDEIKVSYDLFKLLRPPFFVPETKKLNDLLSEFQKRKQHMAMVVDEYGGVSGVVTIEDLLEEIVGEIVDEYDLEEQEPLIKVDENIYSIDARYSMKDFEEELDYELDYEDSETVGGFMLEKLGRIPQNGEELVEPQGVFKVTDIKGNRILRVRFIKNTEFFNQ